MKRMLFWVLFGLTFTVYGAMLGWSLPAVSAAAGGLAPFDMRPGGYGFAEAQAFLRALTPEGAEFYLAVQQRLDIAYPALIGLTLFFAIAALLPARMGRWRYAVALPVLAVTVFDYAENHAVAAMIAAGAYGLTPDLVAEASRWSVLKAGATTVAMSALLVLLVVHGCRLAARLWRRHGTALVARHPIMAFLIAAYAVTWAVQYATVSTGLSMFSASAIGTLLGLALPAVAVTAITSGRAGVTTLLRRLVPRRHALGWYAVAAVGLLAATLVIATLVQGVDALARDWPGLLTGYLPALVATFICIQLCEELGWTGFLHQQLRERRGPLLAALIVAPAFAGSHFMVNLLGAGSIGPALAMLAVQLVFAVAFRLVIGWLYERAGGSVIAAALFRAGFNAMNDPAVVNIVGGAMMQSLVLAIVGLAAVAIVAAAGLRRLPRTGGGVTSPA